MSSRYRGSLSPSISIGFTGRGFVGRAVGSSGSGAASVYLASADLFEKAIYCSPRRPIQAASDLVTSALTHFSLHPSHSDTFATRTGPPIGPPNHSISHLAHSHLSTRTDYPSPAPKHTASNYADLATHTTSNSHSQTQHQTDSASSACPSPTSA
jgi:hypothetical protein